MKYIASVSWGKDSTAMLIKIIENDLPLDEVVFFDTGMEFEGIYKTRDLFVKCYLDPRNIKYTELKPNKPFIDYMINYRYINRKGIEKNGYGWCGGVCRWGTQFKKSAFLHYDDRSIWYIGIAKDEPIRYKRLKDNQLAPLFDWGITEDEALQICYSHGFYFDGLYGILKRVSCWCCRNKNLKELKNYKTYLPEYYKKLCELERIIGEPMKPPYTLEERFGK